MRRLVCCSGEPWAGQGPNMRWRMHRFGRWSSERALRPRGSERNNIVRWPVMAVSTHVRAVLEQCERFRRFFFFLAAPAESATASLVGESSVHVFVIGFAFRVERRSGWGLSWASASGANSLLHS